MVDFGNCQHLRLQYLAREERELHNQEQEELAHLKQELSKLRDSVKHATGAQTESAEAKVDKKK